MRNQAIRIKASIAGAVFCLSLGAAGHDGSPCIRKALASGDIQMPKQPKEKRSDGEPIVTTREFHGHQVEYRKVGNRESLLIDGDPVRFFRVGDDYLLEKNAYGKEAPTLLDAAKAYLKSRVAN